MTTKFDIGDKVYFLEGWGWVEEVRITRFGKTYYVRYPDGSHHHKPESSLRKTYEGKKEIREQ